MAGRDEIAAYAPYFTRSHNEVAADLESYAQLLAKWQPVQNLVSRETLNDVWSRHFADSLQVLKLLKADDRAFLDLGSGGGLPALPLAIALKSPNHHFTLIEPNDEKSASCAQSRVSWG
jgi:16S rRNA (guanine527-N7)-methyltransferase